MHRRHELDGGVASILTLVLMGSLLLGTAIGVGMRLATLEASGGTHALTPVAYAACPGGGEIGTFHRGDRVLATARDESGAWLEVRDPVDLGARVWVETQFVVPDAATRDLPVHECATPEVVTASTTTTTAPSEPGGTEPVGTTDSTGPTIGTIGANPGDIYLQYSGGQLVCQTQVTSALSVPITDPSGVATASFTWSFNTYSGTGGLSTSGGTWTGTLGPFPYPTYDAPVETAITVTVTATDSVGNTGSRSRTVTMHSAADCAP